MQMHGQLVFVVINGKLKKLLIMKAVVFAG